MTPGRLAHSLFASVDHSGGNLHPLPARAKIIAQQELFGGRRRLKWHKDNFSVIILQGTSSMQRWNLFYVQGDTWRFVLTIRLGFHLPVRMCLLEKLKKSPPKKFYARFRHKIGRLKHICWISCDMENLHFSFSNTTGSNKIFCVYRWANRNIPQSPPWKNIKTHHEPKPRGFFFPLILLLSQTPFFITAILWLVCYRAIYWHKTSIVSLFVFLLNKMETMWYTQAAAGTRTNNNNQSE